MSYESQILLRDWNTFASYMDAIEGTQWSSSHGGCQHCGDHTLHRVYNSKVDNASLAFIPVCLRCYERYQQERRREGYIAGLMASEDLLE